MLQGNRGDWGESWPTTRFHLPRRVVFIDSRILQEHVEALFLLCQRVTRDLIDEGLQAAPPILDEIWSEHATVILHRKVMSSKAVGEQQTQ